MNDAAPHTEHLEMGLSHADFFRIFPRLVAPAEVERDGLSVAVSPAAGQSVEIRLSEEKTRRIALLRIVHLDMDITFRGFSADERGAFLTRFHRAFQKGGG